MSLKESIENIFLIKTDYAHPEHAVDQAESLNALSTDLYTDSKRFIYELIQNADDSAIAGTDLNLTIALKGDFLIVTHTGKAFDKRDIEGICGINNGSKKKDSQKTGYKGIGFKAVFGKSEYVLVYTNGEFFRFDSHFNFEWNSKWSDKQIDWEKAKDRKFIYPWQIIPIWTEQKSVPPEINKFIQSQTCTVATVIRLRNLAEAKEAILELQTQSNMFLFLRNVKQIHFDITTPKKISLREDSATGIKEIKTPEGIESNWLLKRIELDVPSEVRAKLQLAGTNIPEKLKTVTKTEIIFAAKNRDGELLSLAPNESLLYSFLPTDIRNYYFPVLINGSFLTNANREQLHVDSSWNQWLFEQIAIELFKWVAILIKDKWKFQGYKLLPSKLNINDGLAQSFDKGFDKAIKEIPFVVNTTGQLLKADEVIIDYIPLHTSTFIGSEIIKEFIIGSNPGIKLHASPFMPYTGFGNQLKKLGIKTFEWKDLPKLLNFPAFNRQHNASNNKLLVRFLYDKAHEEKEDKYITDAKIKDWYFILDHKGNLKIPGDIYFPPKGDSTWNDPNSELSYIHPDVLAWLTENITITSWLQNIGVVEKTDLTYLIKTIIPNASTYITNENAIRIIQWLFNLYLKDEIGREELSQLGELKLLTKNNTLLPAQECYLSDEYLPRLQLEKNCTKDIFATSKYIISNTSIKEWKRFFSFMDVKEGVEVLNYEEKESVVDLLGTNLFSPQYFEEPDKKHKPAFTTFTADEYSELQTLYLLSDINSHSLAKIFWQDVIQNVDPAILSKASTQHWGNSGYAGRSIGDPAESYIIWHKKNIPSIPTTEKSIVTSNNVFLNTAKIAEIAGEYLPVFDVDIPHELSPDWRSFFQFKTELSLSDYFTLLKKISLDKNDKGNVKQENKTRIQFIYEYLLANLANWGSPEIELVKEKSKDLMFLSNDDVFKSPSELHYFSDGDVSLFQGAFQFIHFVKSIRENSNVKTLLSYLGIEVLQMDSFGLEHKNKAIAVELKSKLVKIAPYLAKWVAHQKEGIEEQVLYEIERQLVDKTFYESDTLELTYNATILKRVNVYHRDKEIHVTRPWKSGMVMIDLPKKLCAIFDIKSFEKEIDFLLRESLDVIDDYFIQEGIKIPEKAKGNDDNIDEVIEDNLNSNSFSQTIDYEKLKAIVLKENLSLLKGGGKDSKDLLLHGLDKQTSPFKGHVYHFTHLENMISILQDGALKSRSGALFKNSASTGAIAHTHDEKKDFVRFYFRAKTPTQFYNENLGRGEDSLKKFGSEPVCPIPIFIKIPISDIFSISTVEWEVSLGNMAKANTLYGNSPELIKQFDFNGVYLERDNGFHGRYFTSSQQEFLVKNSLSLAGLNFEIICQDEASKHSLMALLGESNPIINKINVDSRYFYNTNCRVNISTSDESLVAELTEDKNGEIILQYASEEPTNIEGDINATEESKGTRTIYSNQEIKLHGKLSKVLYSMFYSYKGEVWLVNTNQKQSKYNFTYLKSVFDSLLTKKEISGFEIIDTLKTHPLLKYWYSQPIGGVDKLTLEEHTQKVIENYETYFSGQVNLLGNDNHFKVVLALHDIGKPKAVQEKRKELQHEYSLNLISSLSEEVPFFKDNFNIIKAIINADPIGKYLDARFNMPIAESTTSIKSMSEQLGLTIKETWRNILIYYQCDAAGYNSLKTKIFDNDTDGNLVYSEEKKRLLFSNLVEEKFQILEQAIIK